MFAEMPTELLLFFLYYHPKWLEYGLLNEALLAAQGRIWCYSRNNCDPT